MDEATIERMLESAAGFGRCRRCPHLGTGTAVLCYRCARRTVAPLADNRCPVCEQTLESEATKCWNTVCRMAPRDRWFETNHAIALRTTWLKTAVNRYKYEEKRGWAAIFGRILIGFLYAEAPAFDDVDLIVGSPTFVGPDGRKWDHIKEILVAASHEQEPPWMNPWELDLGEPPALIKTAATPRMVGLGAWERRQVAELDLRAALAVPDRSRTEGKVIAVFDDVFTGGWTLREEARALRELGGACSVIGISLARQPGGDTA